MKSSISHRTGEVGRGLVAASGEAQRSDHWIRIDFLYCPENLCVTQEGRFLLLRRVGAYYLS